MMAKRHPYSFEQIWFLDCFGHVISYNNYWHELVRIPLQGFLVSGYSAMPHPAPENFQMKFWDIFGGIVKLPQMTLISWPDGLVSFYCEEKKAYTAIDPGTNKTTWSAHAAEWEKFLPLTRDAFEGLLILTDPALGGIETEEGETLDSLHFVHSQEQKPFTAGFGRKRIAVRENAETFSRIGRLKAGESLSVTFAGFRPGRKYDLVVKRFGQIDF